MGSSGGSGRYQDPYQLDRLQEVARESLRTGQQQQKHNVFISFVEEDLNEVNLLRGQAKNENSSLEFNDYSLKEPFDSTNAEYIRAGIRERIRQSSVTIVYMSELTATSKWVDWEIRETLKMGKGVMAMHKGDKCPTNIPKALLDNNIKPIPA
jgi:hypothetical protein